MAHSASVSLANYDEVEGIPLVTLDDIVHEHIDVLKMDCQVCVVVVSRGCGAPRRQASQIAESPNRRRRRGLPNPPPRHRHAKKLRQPPPALGL